MKNLIQGIIFKNRKAVKNAKHPFEIDSVSIDDSGKVIYIENCTTKGKLKIEIKDGSIVISDEGKTVVTEGD